jgi:hypothetical protein
MDAAIALAGAGLILVLRGHLQQGLEADLAP